MGTAAAASAQVARGGRGSRSVDTDKCATYKGVAFSVACPCQVLIISAKWCGVFFFSWFG